MCHCYCCYVWLLFRKGVSIARHMRYSILQCFFIEKCTSHDRVGRVVSIISKEISVHIKSREYRVYCRSLYYYFFLSPSFRSFCPKNDRAYGWGFKWLIVERFDAWWFDCCHSDGQKWLCFFFSFLLLLCCTHLSSKDMVIVVCFNRSAICISGQSHIEFFISHRDMGHSCKSHLFSHVHSHGMLWNRREWTSW